jgi:S-DNA-T family DNA segregation ATPase FtsK/SpoIIIE
MARKKELLDDEEEEESPAPTRKSRAQKKHIAEETLQGVFALLCFVLGIFFVLARFDLSGIAGEKTYYFFNMLFGVGYLLLPAFFFLLSLSFILNLKQNFNWIKVSSSSVAFLAGIGIVDIVLRNRAGLVGHLISTPLLKLFATYTSLVFLLGLFAIALIILFDARIDSYIFAAGKKLISLFQRTPGNKDKLIDKNHPDHITIRTGENEVIDIDDPKARKKQLEDENDFAPGSTVSNTALASTRQDAEAAKKREVKVAVTKDASEPRTGQTAQRFTPTSNYVPIPVSLLESDKGKPGVGDIKANANIIKRTLLNFGIHVEMDEVSVGPSVTRYALKPAEGVKLAKIVGLQNDLSLALAAHPIRIEAPIPGKSLVGIEIPNTTKTTVGLGTLLSSAEYQESEKPLLFALGKGISGKAHFADLAKMPHMLIAGATGSGKSVTIHAVITSLLYRNSPDNLKFIMIDPKRVELTLYNKIPHLLTPVITDAKKAIVALRWAAKEMDRRYDILQTHAVTNISSYHKTIVEPALKKFKDNGGAEIKISGDHDESQEGAQAAQEKLPDTMPYIAIFIDELADIMQAYPRELESAIVRLAQMSRAVGIHLVLSTQRPSVNVITGLIKANVPSRLALQVASQIDSRTILDASGAEKLLGAGDMLFQSGEMSKPNRIQSAYVTEVESKRVVKFLTENYAHIPPSEINFEQSSKDPNSIFEASLDDEGGDDDDLYEQARDIVMEAGKASTSYIQRKLRVGYARAARLMDLLEQRGVIGPADGSKPRSVIGQEGSTDQEELS